MCFSYLGCLWKLNKNILDRSLSFFGARLFHYHSSVALVLKNKAALSWQQPPEATTNATQMAFDIFYNFRKSNGDCWESSGRLGGAPRVMKEHCWEDV